MEKDRFKVKFDDGREIVVGFVRALYFAKCDDVVYISFANIQPNNTAY